MFNSIVNYFWKTPNVTKSDNTKSDGDCTINEDCLSCGKVLINEVSLECGHKYCLTCIKGDLYNHGDECPECGEEVSDDYRVSIFRSPEKICKVEEINVEEINWLYSGKNKTDTWWHFDKKNNRIVEDLYQLYLKGDLTEKDNRTPICGFTFSFDFDNMQEKSENGIIRDLKRFSKEELEDFKKVFQVKGTCGIKIN